MWIGSVPAQRDHTWFFRSGNAGETDCPGGSSHNIQRTDPNKAIKYLMVTRETRGGVPEPIPYYKENYTYDDCYVPFQEGKSFWYVKPGDSKGGVNVESILVNNKRVHKDKADGRQLVYVILEGSAKVTVDGVPVELSAQSACYVPKGSAGTIAATTTPMRYLQVRTQ